MCCVIKLAAFHKKVVLLKKITSQIGTPHPMTPLSENDAIKLLCLLASSANWQHCIHYSSRRYHHNGILISIQFK